MPATNLSPEEKAEIIARMNAGTMARNLGAAEKADILARMNARDATGNGPTIEATIDRAQMDDETRTFPYAVSSEEPVDRGWWIEVLDHSSDGVDLSRVQPGKLAPILRNHKVDQHVGVVEGTTLHAAEKKTRAIGRISKVTQLANDTWGMMREGTLGNVSVGYHITDATLIREEKGKPPVYRVRWQQLEHSLVAVPADITAGVGRASDPGPAPSPTQRKEAPMGAPVTETQGADAAANNAAADSNANTGGGPGRSAPLHASEPLPGVDLVAQERQRVQQIQALGDMWKGRGGPELAAEFIRGGRSADEYRSVLLERLAAQPNPVIRPAPGPEMGLSRQEVQDFSILKLLRAVCFSNEQQYVKEAAFERDVCTSFMQHVKRQSQGDGYIIPGEILRRPLYSMETIREKGMDAIVSQRQQLRDFYGPSSGAPLGRTANVLLAGTNSLGGYSIATELLASSFIELLRNAAPTLGLSRMLQGLTGNIAIPSQAASTTGYWVSENAPPTESDITGFFGQVTLAPKTVAGYVDISRQLIMQSSLDVEALVEEDLALVLGIAIDLGAICGTGAPQPLGVTKQTGIGLVPFGTSGAAPTWALMVSFLKTQAVANALLGRLSWLINPLVKAALLTTAKASGYPVYIMDAPYDNIIGYPYAMTNNVPSNLTKAGGSNLSAIIFGNFNDLIIGMWDGLDVLRDPFTGGAAGTVRIRAMQSIDVQVRHATSFTVSVDCVA